MAMAFEVELSSRDAYAGMCRTWNRGRRDFARSLALGLRDAALAGRIRLAGRQLANVVAVIRATEPRADEGATP